MFVTAPIVVAAFCSVSIAHADPGDAQFIGILEQHQMGCGEGSFICHSDSELTQMGHSVCDGIDNNGITPVQATDVVMQAMEGNVNKAQADWLVAAALVSYCPWDESQLPGGGAQ
ncbi:hypothetical protein BST44_22800 [Mycobacterium scrofulaceum]|uniref:DUF732 domain-containing protein n=1 Tax=Mycobacterium scrofulaceum TaxID=1783 RepID=A0A1X0K7N8_MYCSC|nr:hypothetical protein BST44_22800 [Mycobacterium scrofulaceum]